MKNEIEILLYKRTQVEKKIKKAQHELEQLQNIKLNIDYEIESLKQLKEKYNLKSL
ncbi:hypothetical protein [Robertmurraya siralis]|uniref:hypothetical protein n=1 Tax=Robertmurraya siralis TaxID=77777 RepID=UPI0014770F0C|nr:hypothetical protein [Robertmurraya siralis]